MYSSPSSVLPSPCPGVTTPFSSEPTKIWHWHEVVAAITHNVMELTHYGHKLPIDKIVSTGVITVFLNWI